MILVALRNALRHARHNAVLAALFALVSCVFLLGNSLLVHSDRALRSLFVSTISGDFAVSAQTDVPLSVFGPATPAIGEYMPVPRLGRTEELAGRLSGLQEVEAVTPLVIGGAVLDAGGARSTVPLFGIDPSSYFSVVDRLVVVRGSRLAPGERGIMLTEQAVLRMSRDAATALRVGEEVVLTAARGTRFRIESVPLTGVVRYPSSIGTVDQVAIVDAATARALADIAPRVQSEDGETTGPRSASAVDDLFTSSVPPAQTAADSDEAEAGDTGGLTVDDVLERVNADDPAAPPESGGAAHFLLVRGDESQAVRDAVAAHGGQTLSWREAAGQPALVARLLIVLFNAGFALLLLAVGFASVNIVVASMYCRTREMGTLRAFGSGTGTVAGLFLVEHLAVAAAGWLAGLLVARAIVAWLSRATVDILNPLLQTVLGGEALVFPLDAATTAVSFPLVVVLVAAAASFPIVRGLRVPIVTAIREA